MVTETNVVYGVHYKGKLVKGPYKKKGVARGVITRKDIADGPMGADNPDWQIFEYRPFVEIAKTPKDESVARSLKKAIKQLERTEAHFLRMVEEAERNFPKNMEKFRSDARQTRETIKKYQEKLEKL